MRKKKKATGRTRAAVAPQRSVSRSYPDSALKSILQELLTGFMIMAESPNIGAHDRASAWVSFDQVLRRYVEVTRAAH